MHSNHPKTVPSTSICGKVIFHETGPWYQKSWGPLLCNFIFSKYAFSFYFPKSVPFGSVSLSRKHSAFPLLISKLLKWTSPNRAPLLYVRNCTESQDFPYLQGNMLVSYCTMDAKERREISGSVTKDFITHSKSNSQSFMFVFVGSHAPHIP